MELFESQWFFRMVDATGRAPADKLLAVFSVTRNWISAPGMRAMFTQTYSTENACLHSCASLKEYLTEIAASARARNPSILASQLVILLQGAIAEEMRNPAAGALDEALSAARAVIDRACAAQQKQRRLLQSMGGVTAAAVLVAAISLHPLSQQALQATAPQAQHAQIMNTALPTNTSPDEIAAILALKRSIDDGRCPAPQLLALPQGQVTAYMNATKFRTPENPVADQQNMRAFLAWFKEARASECYFPPSNGHTTVAWVRR